MNTKPFYQSKTFWANVIGIVISVADGVYGISGIPDSIKVYVILALNLGLRFLTTQPIGK
jgi:hypothetical protein